MQQVILNDVSLEVDFSPLRQFRLTGTDQNGRHYRGGGFMDHRVDLLQSATTAIARGYEQQTGILVQANGNRIESVVGPAPQPGG